MNKNYCCQCGTPRKSFEKQISAYSADAGIISTLKYREKADNPEARNEIYPQLLARAAVFRNGGTSEERTHICPKCVAVGLRMLKEIIDRDLAEFENA